MYIPKLIHRWLHTVLLTHDSYVLRFLWYLRSCSVWWTVCLWQQSGRTERHYMYRVWSDHSIFNAKTFNQSIFIVSCVIKCWHLFYLYSVWNVGADSLKYCLMKPKTLLKVRYMLCLLLTDLWIYPIDVDWTWSGVAYSHLHQDFQIRSISQNKRSNCTKNNLIWYILVKSSKKFVHDELYQVYVTLRFMRNTCIWPSCLRW